MAIRKVKRIPKPVIKQKTEPFDYTTRLMADIEKAYNTKIDKFEFVGYASPNYVSSYARTLAHKFLVQNLYLTAHKEVKERLQAELKRKLGAKTVKYISIPIPSGTSPAMKISGVTVNGQKRVYGEIDFDYIENYTENLYLKQKEYLSKKDVQEQLKRKAALNEEYKARKKLREKNG